MLWKSITQHFSPIKTQKYQTDKHACRVWYFCVEIARSASVHFPSLFQLPLAVQRWVIKVNWWLWPGDLSKVPAGNDSNHHVSHMINSNTVDKQFCLNQTDSFLKCADFKVGSVKCQKMVDIFHNPKILSYKIREDGLFTSWKMTPD